jgi:hypothetical protein
MRTRTVTLHDAGGALLITLLARDEDPSVDSPLRNFDAVQPPGSTVQGVFGDGLHRVGVLERDFALCDVQTYESNFHAKAALEEALDAAASIRVDGWELPLAAVQGITEWQQFTLGFRARIRFIPSSAYWTYLTDPYQVATGLL